MARADGELADHAQVAGDIATTRTDSARARMAQFASAEILTRRDWLTALIGLVSLAVLFRWKVSNPLLIAATAFIALMAYPWLQPGWVMVH